MLNVSCFSFPNKMGKLLQINMKHTAPFIFFLTEAMSGTDTHTQLASNSERVEERTSSARANAAVPIRCGWINDSSHFLGGGEGRGRAWGVGGREGRGRGGGGGGAWWWAGCM